MKLFTSRFGDIEIEESDIIEFPEGLRVVKLFQTERNRAL